MKFSFSIDGMHCGACVARLTRAVSAVPGVTTSKIEIGRLEGEATDDATLGKVGEAIVKAGFHITEA